MASSINLDMLASASPQLIAMLKGKIEEAEREQAERSAAESAAAKAAEMTEDVAFHR